MSLFDPDGCGEPAGKNAAQHRSPGRPPRPPIAQDWERRPARRHRRALKTTREDGRQALLYVTVSY